MDELTGYAGSGKIFLDMPLILIHELLLSSGLHVGEYHDIVQNLGPKVDRKAFINISMFGVEFGGDSNQKSKTEWYKKLQFTAFGPYLYQRVQ